MSRSSLPLSAFPLVRTNTVEEAEYQLSRSLTDLKILKADTKTPFNLSMNGKNFRHTSAVYNHFGSDTIIKSRNPGDSLLFIVGYGAPATFTMNGEAVTVSCRKAAVVAPHHTVRVNRPKDSEVLVIRVSSDVLNNYFQSLTERYHKSRLDFPAELDLRRGVGLGFLNTVQSVVSEFDYLDKRDEEYGFNKIFDHSIITAILNLPHNLKKQQSEIRSTLDMPITVRVAEEYIDANLTEQITITDLIKKCKCSRSALFLAFQTHRGYSPMEFLIERRLQRAKRIFLQDGGTQSIASVALESGFSHLGRFSQTYKKRFGESPSDTLKKRS